MAGAAARGRAALLAVAPLRSAPAAPRRAHARARSGAIRAHPARSRRRRCRRCRARAQPDAMSRHAARHRVHAPAGRAAASAGSRALRDVRAGALPWVVLLRCTTSVLLVTDFVPFDRRRRCAVLKPVFAVGLLAAAWTQERGGRPRRRTLFQRLPRQPAGAARARRRVRRSASTLAVCATAAGRRRPAPRPDRRSGAARPRPRTRRRQARSTHAAPIRASQLRHAVRRAAARCRRCSRCGSRRRWSCSRTAGVASRAAREPARRARQLAAARRLRARGVPVRRRAADARQRTFISLMLLPGQPRSRRWRRPAAAVRRSCSPRRCTSPTT